VRRWVYLAALLLVWMFGPHREPPTETVTAQIRLIDPSARVENARRLKSETDALNAAFVRYNGVLKEAGHWEHIDPDKTLPEAEAILKHWETIIYLFRHYDEVQ